MRMDEIIRICLPFMGAFDLTDDNYRLLARRISDTPQGHSCLLNPKVHVSPCDYFWLHSTDTLESNQQIASINVNL